MKEEIESVIDKARRAIQSSKREFNSGDFDYACSRAYYAVFYLIEGVLMIDNKRFTKHSAVISFFNKDYVKTGIFPVEFSKHIKGSWEVLEPGRKEQNSTIYSSNRGVARKSGEWLSKKRND